MGEDHPVVGVVMAWLPRSNCYTTVEPIKSVRPFWVREEAILLCHQNRTADWALMIIVLMPFYTSNV